MLAATSPMQPSVSLKSGSMLPSSSPQLQSASSKASRKFNFRRSISGGGNRQDEGPLSYSGKEIGIIERKASSSSHSTTTTVTSTKKADGKDALCRAMGALFLQHRVDKLQNDVDRLQREKHCNGRKECSWKTGWKSGYCSKIGKGGSRCAHPDRTRTTSSDASAKTEKASITTKSSFEKRSKSRSADQKKIIIADVSLLIYSLRTVYNWLKEENCRVIVPAEALRTLDVLKKGNHCLNLAARKATRFLDERFDFDISDDEQFKFKAGLYAQKISEKVTIAEWTSLEMTLLEEKNGRHVSQEEITNFSHSIRETLACTLHFIREHHLFPSSPLQVELEHPSVHLALALPPPHFDCAEDSTLHEDIKYGQRADGTALLQISRGLGLADESSGLGNILIVAPTAASWMTVNPKSRSGG